MTLSSEQWELVTENLDWVRQVASNEHRKLQDVLALDECIFEAQNGLMDAARKYKARNGASFRTYAQIVIKGWIREQLRGKCDVTRLQPIAEEIEQCQADDSADPGDILPASMDFNPGRLPQSLPQPVYSDEEEQIWQAWLPGLRFSADGSDPGYKALRAVVYRLTSKGCQLALLLGTSWVYAVPDAHLRARRERTSRSKTSLERQVASVRAGLNGSATKARDLAKAIRALQASVKRNQRHLPQINAAVHRFEDLPNTLDRFADDMKATEIPSNTEADLVSFRRRQLVELVSHVKEHNVRPFWGALVRLVSCWDYGWVDVQYAPHSGHRLLTHRLPRITKTSEALRAEYNHAVKELDGST